MDGQNIGHHYAAEKAVGPDVLRSVLRENPPQYALGRAVRQDKMLMESPQYKHRYMMLRTKYYREEAKLKNLFITFSQNLVRTLTTYKRGLEESRIDYINRLSLQGLLRSEHSNFLLTNLPLVDMIESLLEISHSQKLNDIVCEKSDDFSTIWEFLVQYLPDFFAPPLSEEPDCEAARQSYEAGERLNEGDYFFLPRAIYAFMTGVDNQKIDSD